MIESKNNTAWIRLFEKYKIDERIKTDGFFVISSLQINEFREARLMTKFDHRSQLPRIFSQYNYSILPVSRGTYIISSIETFKKFEPDDNISVQKMPFPSHIESLDYKAITSESAALNCAFVSSMMEDFIGEGYLKPTVNGRMGSSEFDFFINSSKGDQRFKVRNAQLEIDGGYEGKHSLSLFEAKNSISDDFLIRQLYFPYRLWESKIKKKVRSVFFTYTNGIFHFREYEFENPKHYNSIRLIDQKKYSISDGIINSKTIQELIRNTPTLSEPSVPFPQADNFKRVINLCELLLQKTFLTRDDITYNYDFNQRQTNYYTDAGRYLGLIEKKREAHKIRYFLTEKGMQIFRLSPHKRQIQFATLILSHAPFKKTLEHFFKENSIPELSAIVKIMKNSNLNNIESETTFRRRAFTISGWVNWILGLIEQ